jgi:hypothetical protein
MKNKKALELAESLIVNYSDFTSKRYNKLKDTTFESIYGQWDGQTYVDLRNLFFTLVTGEDDFDDFYDRFDAPATHKGKKPVAWGERFIPDMISDDIFDTRLDLENRVKRIEKMYKKCVKLEKEFKRK